MGKRILVIGGTGFLGTAVVRELHAAGLDVTILSRGQRTNSVGDVPLIVADRSIPGALAEATKGREFDVVADLAAFRPPDIEAAALAFSGRIRQYVFISTDLVYAARPDLVFPIREDSPGYSGDMPYAVGKVECEAALAQLGPDALPYTILRPPHIMGTGRALGCDPLAFRDPKLLDKMRAGEELTLLAEGQLLIQPVWNREIGACIAHMAGIRDASAMVGRTFNMTGPECVTTRRYYEVIAEVLGVPLRTRSVSLEEFLERSPDQIHMTRHRIYDLSALVDATGYKPHMRLEDAIRETVGWMDAAA